MRFTDLSADALEKVRRYRFDRFVEKHEGPWRWSTWLEHGEYELLDVQGHAVLLPVESDHFPNITILRCIEGEGGKVLTIFLRDTTYGHETFDSGFLAFCEQVPGEEFYLTMVYHEWFIVEAPAV